MTNDQATTSGLLPLPAKSHGKGERGMPWPAYCSRYLGPSPRLQIPEVWDLPDVAGPRSKGVEFHGRHAGKEHRERAERECRRPRNPLGLQLCNKGLLALHGCLQLLPGGGRCGTLLFVFGQGR